MAVINIREIKEIEKQEGTVEGSYIVDDVVAFDYNLLLTTELVDKVLSAHAKTRGKMARVMFKKGKVNSLNIDEETLINAFQNLDQEELEEVTNTINREILDFVLGDFKEEVKPVFEQIYGEGLVEYKLYDFLDEVYTKIGEILGK